jgi:hypothetical protein
MSAGGVPLVTTDGSGPYTKGYTTDNAATQGLTPQLMQWGVQAPMQRHRLLSAGALTAVKHSVSGTEWNGGVGGSGLRLLLLEWRGVAADAQLGVFTGDGNAWRVQEGTLWVPRQQQEAAGGNVVIVQV